MANIFFQQIVFLWLLEPENKDGCDLNGPLFENNYCKLQLISLAIICIHNTAAAKKKLYHVTFTLDRREIQIVVILS